MCGGNIMSDLKIVNLFREVLEKKERIGKGAYGEVFLCEHRLDGREYAVKKIKVDSQSLDWFLREVHALSCFKHDNIVRYYQSWTDENSTGFSSQESGGFSSQEGSQGDDFEESPLDMYLFIQMEYCPSTLAAKIKSKTISSNQALLYFRDMVGALAYVHECGFLHRDLSSNNIFFGGDGKLKIGDFGLAKKLSGPRDNSYCSQSPAAEGAGFYCAPELKKKQPYTEKSDIYSLGVIFLEMLMLFTTDHEMHKTILEARKGNYPDGWESRFETDILKKLLAESPDDRFKADDVMQMIEANLTA